jgi:hypothetical protein
VESTDEANRVKNLTQIVKEEVAREVEILTSRALADRASAGYTDIEALEMAVRSTMHDFDSVFLSQLIDIDCGHGHRAEFLEYRTKTVTTVPGPVEVRRAYYHCQACGAGVIPKDQELDVVGSSPTRRSRN